MIALVFLLILDSIFLGSILYDSSFISTNTGFAPVLLIASTEEIQVKGEVITSSPFPIPDANRERNKADVPDETPTQYFIFK